MLQPEEVGRRQHERVRAPVRLRRRGEVDLLHAGHLRGDSIHEQARRVEGRSARHVEADALHGHDALAEQHAVAVVHEPRLLHLPRVVPADVGLSLVDDPAQVAVHRLRGRLKRRYRHLQRVGPDAVEALREVEHGGVAALPHAVEDLAHGRIHLFTE